MVRGHLPEELGIVGIAAPCKVEWSSMLGDDRTRHCGSCNLNVYNLDGLTAFEVRDLLMKSEGRLCVRLFVRRDGTVLTRDCPNGWSQVVKVWKDQRARARLARASPILWVSMALVLTANLVLAKMGVDVWAPFRSPKECVTSPHPTGQLMGAVIVAPKANWRAPMRAK